MKLCPSVENGFYFNCQQCGKCCSQETEGYIFVFWPDITKICASLKISNKDFARKYLDITNYEFIIWNKKLEDSGIRRTIPTLILNAEKTKDCIFLENNDGKAYCQIYDTRPFQCICFPCWSMIMTSETVFIENCESCGGLNASQTSDSKIQGKFFTPKEITKWVKQERQIEYNYCDQMDKCDNDIFCIYPFLKGLDEFEQKLS